MLRPFDADVSHPGLTVAHEREAMTTTNELPAECRLGMRDVGPPRVQQGPPVEARIRGERLAVLQPGELACTPGRVGIRVFLHDPAHVNLRGEKRTAEQRD